MTVRSTDRAATTVNERERRKKRADGELLKRQVERFSDHRPVGTLVTHANLSK